VSGGAQELYDDQRVYSMQYRAPHDASLCLQGNLEEIASNALCGADSKACGRGCKGIQMMFSGI
jgi:hypothetical protein